MCDYSLMGVPNRLATEGEELVTYTFSTGSIGLATEADIRRQSEVVARVPRGFWPALRRLINPPQTSNQVAAVCIPPGARLTLHGIPENLQQRFGVGSTEEVTFTQITAAANSYRDAVRFSNGREVRLQELLPGQRVQVRDLSFATFFEPAAEERIAY
jgi:hypothetical protein